MRDMIREAGSCATADMLTTARLQRTHVLLGIQSLLLVLASVNRLWSATDVPLLPHGSLRLVEVLNLFVFPPLSVFAFYLLLEHVMSATRPRVRFRLRLAFLGFAYLFAMSYGMHEPTNYLHERFCDPVHGRLCSILAYQDDGLSHYLFFLGFAGIDGVLLAAQALAFEPATAPRDRLLIGCNALLVAAAIVANLGFETIGLDLYVVAVVAVGSLALLWRFGARPLILYFASAYTVGLLVTALVKV